MPTVTFKVTDTEKKINVVSHLLKTNQVHFQKENEEREKRLMKHMELARHYRENPLLTGHGEEVGRLRKEFREDFEL